MNKYVEKVENYKKKILGTALEKLKAEYAEAKDFYSDTGYDRYYNKMQKCEAQIDEIEEYLYPAMEAAKDITTDQYREFLELKRIMQSVKSNVTYIMADLPECTEKIRLNDVLKEIESF